MEEEPNLFDSNEPSRATPSILVVDDEPHVCAALRRLLCLEGFEVHTASGCADALELLDTLDVQVVVSDLHMPPGPDGIHFLCRVRERQPRVQRILLTGHGELEHIQRAINEASVHCFLTKPWRPGVMVEAVQAHFERWAVKEQRDRLLGVTRAQNAALRELASQLEGKVRERTAKLQHATEAWRRTFDAIADPMTLVDSGGRILRANQAAALAAGGPALIGRRCHQALFGRDRICASCPLWSGDGARDRPARAELFDERGGRIWRVSAWALLAADGADEQGDAFVCHYQDITQAAELQRQVVILEKMAAVGELAGCVAHELNSPLSGILTFSQILGRRVPDPSHQEFANNIEEAARRCSSIVRSLLNFARPSGHPGGQRIDMALLLESCVEMARLQQPRGGDLTIETHFAPDLWPVEGQPDALKSVFLNLINNAVQAVRGDGLVRIEASNRPQEGQIRVRVSDTGPGIPPNIIDKIFEPFFTTKAASKTGTGLGLSIVRNAVQEHDGALEVSNRPGGGACFVIDLPAQHEDMP